MCCRRSSRDSAALDSCTAADASCAAITIILGTEPSILDWMSIRIRLSFCMWFATTSKISSYKRFSFCNLALSYRLGSCSHKGEASSVVVSILEAMDKSHRSRCSEFALHYRTLLDHVLACHS